MKRLVLLIAGLAVSGSVVHAFPEGAPWGAADPAAAEHCASCHWERAPRHASPQLRLAGFPSHIEPGKTYALTLTLLDPAMKTSGFQLLVSADGQPAGQFLEESAATEVAMDGMQLRSERPQSALAGRVRWRLRWRAPARLNSRPVFIAAASAANDDGSPFGDTIHYRSFEAPPQR